MKFSSSLKLKLIYVMRINDKAHQECLKIGEATSDSDNILDLKPNCKALNDAAHKRIKEYTQTAGIHYDLLHTELTVFSKNGTLQSFSDHEVHYVLARSGIKKKIFNTKNKSNEWFVTDLETVKKAIKAVKEGQSSLNAKDISTGKSPIIFRPEQREAIDKTIKIFKKSNAMLWNAKMRFGKTLSALQVVKEMALTRTLILTHRPVVNEGWFEDFTKIFYDSKDYSYGSKIKGKKYEELETQCKKSNGTKKYVYFASMQDLRGSEKVGGNFDKNDEIFKTKWDLIIVDEAHEGTQTELGRKVVNLLLTKDSKKKTGTKLLKLSGTPFNLLDEYSEDEIFTWDYVMEQRAKKDWYENHFGDYNPYASLPRMNIYTYDLGELINNYDDEDVAFNFTEFFRVDDAGKFIHDKDISSFLDLICKKDKDSYYPYSTEEFRDNFRHSLWMVPGVKEARALSEKLQKHKVFRHFKIVNVAGDGDEEESGVDALKKVQDAIGEKPHETYSITLSCGRLTTGVTVPAWTAVFMLSGSYNTSASAYMQTIFRVQSPAEINGRVKEECYVFDFAPDRTLKVVADTTKISAKVGKTSSDDRKAMGEFLNFCPIISVSGSRMSEYNVEGMLEQLKKYYVERVVRSGFEHRYLYNSEMLMKLDGDDLKSFAELKEIIGATKASHKSSDIDVNKQGFTGEDYDSDDKKKKVKRTIDPEEQKRREQRDAAISILRGISIRMPLLIYGADVSDEDEKITIDKFTQLIDDKSWEEFMPKGVGKDTFEKFKKYYEPDVFRAAGKSIRAFARAADTFSIEDRIDRIKNIFSNFRNPDKETVLTPWKVVNMHIGDCLGGYVFYDKEFENTIEKPRLVEQSDVTKNVFYPDSKILEINSKSGLYPLYMAYSIYRSRLDKLKKKKLTPEEQIEIWDNVLAENIFVICKTPMAKSITKRTLAGFRNAKVNAEHFDDLISEITDNPVNFIKKVKQGKTFWKNNKDNNMKFDAIVGNPPYQVMDGGAGVSAKPVYNYFVNIARKIEPQYISMITPSRWFAGGKGLDEYRSDMLNDRRISKIIDFTNAKDCFPNTSISGGINFFLWVRNYIGDCEFCYVHDGIKETMIRKLNEFPVFIRYNKALNIINKINLKSISNLLSIVSSRNPFGLSSNTRGNINIFNDSILLYSSEGKSFIRKAEVDKTNQFLNMYKVMISKVTSEHAGEPDKSGKYRVLSRSELLHPNEVCTDSYLVIGNFDKKEYAVSLLKYLKTKFSRFLLLQAITSINLSKEKFTFVPLQDFTTKSDIDWSKPIAEIDKQLYKKYGLTKEEIGFIESMIKPME